MEKDIIIQSKMVIQRLERLSADSIWAHRASGVRASLNKLTSNFKGDDEDRLKIDALTREGFAILENAAGEIPTKD